LCDFFFALRGFVAAVLANPRQTARINWQGVYWIFF